MKKKKTPTSRNGKSNWHADLTKTVSWTISRDWKKSLGLSLKSTIRYIYYSNSSGDVMDGRHMKPQGNTPCSLSLRIRLFSSHIIEE